MDDRVRLHGPQRIVVVANPKSRVSPDRLETLVRAYMPQGSHVILRHTKPDMPIRGIIEDELDKATVAIASGGDGTVSPRTLDPELADALWSAMGRAAKLMARKSPGGLVLEDPEPGELAGTPAAAPAA